MDGVGHAGGGGLHLMALAVRQPDAGDEGIDGGEIVPQAEKLLHRDRLVERPAPLVAEERHLRKGQKLRSGGKLASLAHGAPRAERKLALPFREDGEDLVRLLIAHLPQHQAARRVEHGMYLSRRTADGFVRRDVFLFRFCRDRAGLRGSVQQVAERITGILKQFPERFALQNNHLAALIVCAAGRKYRW